MFCVDDPAGRIINHSLSHEGEAHVIPPTAELEIAWSCQFNVVSWGGGGVKDADLVAIGSHEVWIL